MSNLGEMVKRTLKGDIDPAHILGSPTSAEKRANAIEREHRGSQIDFEQNDKLLKKSGGSTDPATRQIKKLKDFRLTPKDLFISGGDPLLTAIAGGRRIKKGRDTKKDIKDVKAGESTRLSPVSARSILGRLSG